MLSFREVGIDDAEMIRRWRTKERVSVNMNTDVDNTIEQQKAWIVGKQSDSSYYHWIIQAAEKDIGLVYLSDIDVDDKTTSWGFYIGDDDHLGFGGFVPLYLYSFVFHKLNLKTVVAEVLYYNIDVIRMHLQHGYTFSPRMDHVIEKRGNSVLVVGMELSKSQFTNSRYNKFIIDLPSKHWVANPFSVNDG